MNKTIAAVIVAVCVVQIFPAAAFAQYGGNGIPSLIGIVNGQHGVVLGASTSTVHSTMTQKEQERIIAFIMLRIKQIRAQLNSILASR
jgi:hypothetical protein